MFDSTKLPDNTTRTTHVNHSSNDVVYPRLGLKVLLVGDCFRTGAIAMFAEAACKRAENVADADLICFLGGEDVDPQLYGERQLRGTYFNRSRDDAEIAIFEEAQTLGKPCFGICRGMQLLHVLNGGKLWQHVARHAGTPHAITDLVTGEVIEASSMHHQMCIENDTTFAVAYATGHAGTYVEAGREISTKTHDDLEAAIWPAINSFGVQGHPEVAGLPKYTAWCLEKLDDFLTELQGMGDNLPARIPPAINKQGIN